MDADVVSNFRPQAFASRTAAERVKTGAMPPAALWNLSAAGRNTTAAAEGRAGPSAASPLLPDGRGPTGDLLVARNPGDGRLRRGFLHPAPRRSQRRPHPFSAPC